jgi:fucose permease
MVAMVIGYILGIMLIPKVLSQQKALQISAILGVIFSIGVLVGSPMVSVTFVALLGFANAIVWPAIWPLALNGLGRFIKTGSALLVMAISGGAILPLVWGQIADMSNTQIAYWILIPCYLFIFGYAFIWHKKKSW